MAKLKQSESHWSRFWRWLLVLDKKCKCSRPQWRVLIEHYPTFTKDYWQCQRCGCTQVFENSEPPVKMKKAICSLGHIHITN